MGTQNKNHNIVEVTRDRLGNYGSIVCPNCGGHATLDTDDREWWYVTCDDCLLEYGFDPKNYVPFDVVQQDWKDEWDDIVVTNRGSSQVRE